MKYKVIDTRFSLVYDTHTRKNSGRLDRFKIGDVVTWESDAGSGNVWFLDHNGNRGKIEAGCVDNLVRRGTLEETNE